MFKKIIERKEARKKELIARSKTCDDVKELRSIQQKIEELNEDIAELRDKQAQYEAEHRAAEEKGAKHEKSNDNLPDNEEKQKPNERTAAVNSAETPEAGGAETRGASPDFMPGKGFTSSEEQRGGVGINLAKELEKREAAGKELKEDRTATSNLGITGEIRSVTIGDGTSIVIPQSFSSTINPDFPVVSSLIDGVDHLTLNGGESFRQPYVKSIQAGDYTGEGENAKEADTQFAYADIMRTKITAYSEISKELRKLPNAPYADVVFQNIRTSMRMVITKEILIGAGGTNQIIGIFSNKATAIDAVTDLEISEINDKTLNEILFHYGGVEDVEGAACLILNKLDLLAFANVRTSTRQQFYDIKSNGNTGTISGVPYIINSACKQLTATDTESGAYCMAYGNLRNYKLVEFSPVEVERSEEYKFKEGMIAHRGEVFVGGNVVRKNGFLRIKKAATV